MPKIQNAKHVMHRLVRGDSVLKINRDTKRGRGQILKTHFQVARVGVAADPSDAAKRRFAMRRLRDHQVFGRSFKLSAPDKPPTARHAPSVFAQYVREGHTATRAASWMRRSKSPPRAQARTQARQERASGDSSGRSSGDCRGGVENLISRFDDGAPKRAKSGRLGERSDAAQLRKMGKWLRSDVPEIPAAINESDVANEGSSRPRSLLRLRSRLRMARTLAISRAASTEPRSPRSPSRLSSRSLFGSFSLRSLSPSGSRGSLSPGRSQLAHSGSRGAGVMDEVTEVTALDGDEAGASSSPVTQRACSSAHEAPRKAPHHHPPHERAPAAALTVPRAPRAAGETAASRMRKSAQVTTTFGGGTSRGAARERPASRERRPQSREAAARLAAAPAAAADELAAVDEQLEMTELQ